MIIKDCNSYSSDDYKRLEQLKVKINNLHKYEDDGK